MEIDKYKNDNNQVYCGTYIETIRALSFKDSSYRVGMLVWFRWENNNDLVFNYETNYGSPSVDKDGGKSSEILTSIYLNRNSLGLYFKCFIALFGTIIWVLMVLYMSAFHSVDSLTFIPAALFGSVSNIMIGANLLPDGLEFGLLEMVNIFGVFIIIFSALIIMHINNLRRKEADQNYCTLFVKTMFFIILIITIIANIILPLSAYTF